MKKIAIVTDTNSGLLPEDVKGRDIFVLPMPFLIDGEEYFEGISLDQVKFFNQLEGNSKVSTSQPSLMHVAELWDKVLKDYEQIIHIPMSSGLSATCENAIKLSEEYNGRVVVVDNRRISAPQKRAVLDAEKMVLEGKGVEEIVKYLHDTKFDSCVYIMVTNLKYLKKGGRLTPAAAAIGTLLNIKPVLQIQGGKIDTYAKVMSVKQALKTVIKAMKDDMQGRFKKYVDENRFEVQLVYSKDKQAAEAFKLEAEKELGIKIEMVDPLSLVVACHTGPGAIALTCSVTI